MDFTNRSPQPQHTPVATPATPTNNNSARKSNDSDKKWQSSNGLLRWLTIVLTAAIVILLIGVTVALSKSNGDGESNYVDTSKLQAVFLNTGQVYFGNLKTVNSKYFVLTNIYYLQTANSGSSTSSTTASSNVSLVKLGCELHQPYDQMIINRDEVTFWENLQSTGQVAKAVATFQQQHPNGQQCSDQSSSASTGTGAATQNAGTTTTPSTSTTTTKP